MVSSSRTAISAEETEFVVIGDPPTRKIVDKYWELVHPPMLEMSTPVVQTPESLFNPASLALESEEPKKSPYKRLQKGLKSPTPPMDNIPEGTKCHQQAEENTPSQDNSSQALPVEFLVHNRRVNLKHVPYLTRMRGIGRQIPPKFNEEKVARERRLFKGANPYDSPCTNRFWTDTQHLYYTVVLFNQNRGFPHSRIVLEAMEKLPCFDELTEAFHSVGLLQFICDEEHLNEEIILQFFATLHISGNNRYSSTWVLDWLTGNTHFLSPATELLHHTWLAYPEENTPSLFKEPKPNTTQMLCLMEPQPADVDLPKHFFVKDL